MGMEPVDQGLLARLISGKLNLPFSGVRNTLSLLDEGCTIPFISRYRKERTNGLDEVAIGLIRQEYQVLQELLKRKESVMASIQEQGLLSEVLKDSILSCWNPRELEDIYQPFKPRRRTRATMAREAGLGPLAHLLFQQKSTPLAYLAGPFLQGSIVTVEMAIAGAGDILAEQFADDARARGIVRETLQREGILFARLVKGKEEEASRYRDYFEYAQVLKRCPSHRLLAMLRASGEGLLRVGLEVGEESCVARISSLFVRNYSEAGQCVAHAVVDGYKRLLFPSIENEVLGEAR
jgi:uncharacterized protein